jgi:hypothetical protein
MTHPLRSTGITPLQHYYEAVRAGQRLQLAKEAEDFYVKSALIELAEEFKKQAERIKVGLPVAPPVCFPLSSAKRN